MQQSKLLTVLRSLDKKELKNFRQFLESPWFNTHEERIRLFDILAKHAPEFSSDAVAKEAVFGQMFPGEEFDAARLHHRASELFKLLEKFLVQVEIERDRIQQDFMLLRATKERKLDAYFQRTSNALENKLTKGGNRDWLYYLNLFRVNYLAYTHPETDKLQTTVGSLQQSMNNLDLFFAAAKLKLAVEMRNRERILNNTYEIHFLDEVIRLADTPNFQSNPIFGIYSKFLQSFMDFESVPFEELRDLFMDNHGLFSPREQIDYFVFLINAYSFAYRSGANDIRRSQFELYRMALDRGFLVEDGSLDPQFFNHIVLIASALGEFTWTRNFIDDYEVNLPKKDRNDFREMGNAELAFASANYEEAGDHLMRVSFKDIAFKLRVRAMEICLDYEYGYLDVMENHLAAFNMFLRRDKSLAKPIVERNQNFIKAQRSLLRLALRPTYDRNPEEAVEQIKEVQQLEPLIYKNWLLNKFEALAAPVRD